MAIAVQVSLFLTATVTVKRFNPSEEDSWNLSVYYRETKDKTFTHCFEEDMQNSSQMHAISVSRCSQASAGSGVAIILSNLGLLGHRKTS